MQEIYHLESQRYLDLDSLVFFRERERDNIYLGLKLNINNE